jgi:hypothetical protein
MFDAFGMTHDTARASQPSSLTTLLFAATTSTRDAQTASSAGPLARRQPTGCQPRRTLECQLEPGSHFGWRPFCSAAVGLGLAELALRIRMPHVRETALPGNLLTISDDLDGASAPP